MDNFEEKYKHWHQRISYVKSFTRILACLLCAIIVSFSLTQAVLILSAGLFVAELLGIAEEWI